MLDRYEAFNRWLSDWFQLIGFGAMLLIMFITCVDVVAAKLFSKPILGALDMVVLCQIIAISFAGSMTLIVGRHIEVEFFFDLLPRPLQLVIQPLIHLIGLGLFMLVVWRLATLGYDFMESGEYSPTAYIPMFPFAFGAALATVPVCLVLLYKLLKSLNRKSNK